MGGGGAGLMRSGEAGGGGGFQKSFLLQISWQTTSNSNKSFKENCCRALMDRKRIMPPIPFSFDCSIMRKLYFLAYFLAFSVVKNVSMP